MSETADYWRSHVGGRGMLLAAVYEAVFVRMYTDERNYRCLGHWMLAVDVDDVRLVWLSLCKSFHRVFLSYFSFPSFSPVSSMLLLCLRRAPLQQTLESKGIKQQRKSTPLKPEPNNPQSVDAQYHSTPQ